MEKILVNLNSIFSANIFNYFENNLEKMKGKQKLLHYLRIFD